MKIDDDSRTRDRVCQAVVEQGPVTASDLAQTLSLTAAAVRKHLDALAGDGLVDTWRSAPPSQRGRGRPARQFVATDSGHAAIGTEYGDLATEALRYLSSTGGAEAVRRFAYQRSAGLEQRLRPAVDAAGPDPELRAHALADALSSDGYAASSRPLKLGETPIGVQLCQGHCPVHRVAREFPELCEAETDAFSRLLGVHVQRLATLAHGEHVCTTHIPTTHVPTTHVPLPTERHSR
jgi:predicted ArsR family transcriptional regulator